MKRLSVVLGVVVAACLVGPAWPQATLSKGEVKGTATAHTPDSSTKVIAQANVALPAKATGGAATFGKWQDLPRPSGAKVPVVIFLHGSSGSAFRSSPTGRNGWPGWASRASLPIPSRFPTG